MDWTDMPGEAERTEFTIEGLVPSSEYTVDIRSHRDGETGAHASVSFVTLSGVSTEEEELPTVLSLSQNYPNPFNPSTAIEYALPQAAEVRLSVVDLMGREVVVLVNGTKQAGNHEVQFDASGLPSGMYLYRLETPERVLVHRMTLLK